MRLFLPYRSNPRGASLAPAPLREHLLFISVYFWGLALTSRGSAGIPRLSCFATEETTLSSTTTTGFSCSRHFLKEEFALNASGRVKQWGWGAAKSRCCKWGESRSPGGCCVRGGAVVPSPVRPILTLTAAKLVNFYIFHCSEMKFLLYLLILWK